MAVSAKWYGKALKEQLDGTAVADWDTDDIKVALCTSAYTPDQDAHDYLNDITNELSGGGYVRKSLANKTAAYDSGTNEARLDADDVVWSGLTAADIRYAIVFKDTGNAATSKLLGYVDAGGLQAVSAGTFTITWDATGVLKVTAS